MNELTDQTTVVGWSIKSETKLKEKKKGRAEMRTDSIWICVKTGIQAEYKFTEPRQSGPQNEKNH